MTTDSEKPKSGAVFVCRFMTAKEWLQLPPRQRFAPEDQTTCFGEKAKGASHDHR